MMKIEQRGFTLLEMIVSVGLFSVVMLIATSAYLTLISIDREVRTTNEVANNLSFAIDDLARSLRTGSDYRYAGGKLTFTDSNNCTVIYRLSEPIAGKQALGKCEQEPAGGTCATPETLACASRDAVPVTDERIDIELFNVYLRGQSTSDTEQPRVTFTLKGVMEVGANSEPAEFIIQGGATQRVIDIAP